MNDAFVTGELVALGAFAGALVLIVCLCAIFGSVYRERALLVQAAVSLLAVLAIQSLAGEHPLFPEAVMLLVLGAAGFQLGELASHAGAMQQPRRWLLGISLGLLPGLGVASAWYPWLLLPGLAAWTAVVGVVLLRAWPQSRPWIAWLAAGCCGLLAAAATLAWRSVDEVQVVLPVGALLTLGVAATFLATLWRGRILSETRVRMDARSRVDPLTGLSTTLVLQERIRAARNLIRRYGHPSVLLLAHIENLDRLAAEFGPEAAEATVLTAASRVQQALREGDVAARLSHPRIAVLAEGLSPAEAASIVASRILVAGMKEPIPAVPAEFIQFRIVLATVPVDDIAPRLLLQRLGAHLDRQLQSPGERRIVSLGHDDLLT